MVVEELQVGKLGGRESVQEGEKPPLTPNEGILYLGDEDPALCLRDPGMG